VPPEEWATCFVLSVRREKGFESREGEKEESSESHSLLFVQAVSLSLSFPEAANAAVYTVSRDGA
jgi:hypothetical protein